MSESKLCGTWGLTSWVTLLDGAPRASFLGPRPKGMLIYTEEGYVSAILTAPDRPLVGPAGFVPGTKENKLAAAEGYVSYAGRYWVEEDKVHHRVIHSLYPDWIGQTLVRRMEWSDGDLILTTPEQVTAKGKVFLDRLHWARLPAPGNRT